MEEVNGAIQDIAKYSIQTRREKLNVATPIMKKIKEICAAWNQAAQLITFTCGPNPSFCSSNVWIIRYRTPVRKLLQHFLRDKVCIILDETVLMEMMSRHTYLPCRLPYFWPY